MHSLCNRHMFKKRNSRSVMPGRESHRVRDAEKKRVLDETARKRRSRKAVEALELDNFHDDPHANLVMSKKIPKFNDSLETTRTKKSKRKGGEFYRAKYRKNFAQLIEEVKQTNPYPPNYLTAQAPPSPRPPRYFCAVCGTISSYTCVSCGTRYCSIRCRATHQETRCLKWTA